MRLIISTISHGHDDVIINLGALRSLAKDANIVVLCRDNLPRNKLQRYCKKYGIDYVANAQCKGFAENHNLNFTHYLEHLNPEQGDYFVVLNPDVLVGRTCVRRLRNILQRNQRKILVANLYLDREHMVHDDNIRLFPTLVQFMRTYLLSERSTMIDRSQGLSDDTEFWASGAFLVFEPHTYATLGGFNERFYMYCEDIDLFRRARMQNVPIHYEEAIKAVHFRRRYSKRFMTKHFFWHVVSVLRLTLGHQTSLAVRSCVSDYFAQNEDVLANQSSDSLGPLLPQSSHSKQ